MSRALQHRPGGRCPEYDAIHRLRGEEKVADLCFVHGILQQQCSCSEPIYQPVAVITGDVGAAGLREDHNKTPFHATCIPTSRPKQPPNRLSAEA